MHLRTARHAHVAFTAVLLQSSPAIFHKLDTQEELRDSDCFRTLSCNCAPALCEEAKISASKQVLNHFKYDRQG